MSSKQRKTHDDFRKCVCLLCFKKRKGLQNITNIDWESINTYFVSGLSPHDDRLPTVLYLQDRLMVHEARLNDGYTKNVELFDYSKLTTLRSVTRTSSPCECVMCVIGRSTPFNGGNKENFIFPRGRPKPTSSPTPIKVCSACLSEVAKGKPHDCSDLKRLGNLKAIITDSPPKTDEKVAAAILTAKPSGDEQITLTREKGGKPLTLSLMNKSKVTKPSPIKFDEFNIISQHLDHSVNKTLNLAKDLRATTRNRKVICPNLRNKIEVSSHRLDEIYTVVGANLKAKVSKDVYQNVDTPVVYCTNIDMLLETVIEERGGNDNFELKLGIDGGGGFIKICLNVVDLDEDFSVSSSSKRARYSDGLLKSSLSQQV